LTVAVGNIAAAEDAVQFGILRVNARDLTGAGDEVVQRGEGIFAGQPPSVSSSVAMRAMCSTSASIFCWLISGILLSLSGGLVSMIDVRHPPLSIQLPNFAKSRIPSSWFYSC
jgi:hypothetical protein